MKKMSNLHQDIYHHDLTKDLKRCLLYHDPTIDARLTRVVSELKKGFAFLETFVCDKVVTIFGSARFSQRNPYYQKARELAKRLAEKKYTIITGGGPGIMEAANRGATEVQGRSAGINIYLRNGERKNRFVKEGLGFYYFFNRKVILAYTAEAFVYFPGGYGTLDELFEISTLVATKKIDVKIPIILIGKTFWKPLQNWLKKYVKEKVGAIKQSEIDFWHITDRVPEAIKIIDRSLSRQS